MLEPAGSAGDHEGPSANSVLGQVLHLLHLRHVRRQGHGRDMVSGSSQVLIENHNHTFDNNKYNRMSSILSGTESEETISWKNTCDWIDGYFDDIPMLEESLQTWSLKL